jgi:hypothetical protein
VLPPGGRNWQLIFPQNSMCHYAKCQYAKCCGAVKKGSDLFLSFDPTNKNLKCLSHFFFVCCQTFSSWSVCLLIAFENLFEITENISTIRRLVRRVRLVRLVRLVRRVRLVRLVRLVRPCTACTACTAVYGMRGLNGPYVGFYYKTFYGRN